MPTPKVASKAATSKRRASAKDDSNDLPAEPGVTKRTLQNRKAQREFRKRREARVKHLEERCRRFDEIGVEANIELQRAARRLKDENEALKDLLTRLGYGRMIAPILESLDGEDYSDANLYARAGIDAPKKFDDFDSDAEEDDEEDADEEERADSPPTNPNLSLNVGLSGIPTAAETASPATGSKRARGQQQPSSNYRDEADANANKRRRSDIPSPEEDVKPVVMSHPVSTGALAARRAARNGAAEAIGRWNEPGRNSHPSEAQQQGSRSSGTSADSSPESNGLLSLAGRTNGNATRDTAHQQQVDQNGQTHQQQSESADMRQQYNDTGNASPAVSYVHNSSGSRMMPMPSPSSFSNNYGPLNAGTPGSGAFGTPFMHLTQQDGALLNPNPIPFAFNLSASSQSSPPDRSWWDTMGGAMLTPGQDPNDLDEKAGAVAQAMVDPQSRHGDFEFNGLYGFNAADGQWTNSDESSQGQNRRDGGLTVSDSKVSSSSRSPSFMQRGLSTASQQSQKSSQPLSRAEHAQMFLRLIESKVAQSNRGDKQPYTALGFQPPWQAGRQQQQQQQQFGTNPSARGVDGVTPGSANMASWIDFGNSPSEASSGSGPSRSPSVQSNSSSASLSPGSIYHRLSQHPAFLSTSAQELEELVEHLRPRSGKMSPSGEQNSLMRSRSSADMTGAMPSPVQRAMLQAQRAMHAAHSQDDKAKSRSADGAAKPDARNDDVEVDENALDHLMTLLDRKKANVSGAGSFGQTSMEMGRDQLQQMMQQLR